MHAKYSSSSRIQKTRQEVVKEVSSPRVWFLNVSFIGRILHADCSDSAAAYHLGTATDNMQREIHKNSVMLQELFS